ncbi:hypothetical protein [Escherichia coli]
MRKSRAIPGVGIVPIAATSAVPSRIELTSAIQITHAASCRL